MIHWIYYLVLAAVLIGGLYLTLLNFPGLWVMVVATAIYALLTHFADAGLKTLIAILVLAGIAELIDFLAAGAGAKKAGASKRGFVGAVVGGILAGLFLTISIPVIGTIIGICIGTFAGRDNHRRALGRHRSCPLAPHWRRGGLGTIAWNSYQITVRLHDPGNCIDHRIAADSLAQRSCDSRPRST